jgi:hypothetical protein
MRHVKNVTRRRVEPPAAVNVYPYKQIFTVHALNVLSSVFVVPSMGAHTASIYRRGDGHVSRYVNVSHLPHSRQASHQLTWKRPPAMPASDAEGCCVHLLFASDLATFHIRPSQRLFRLIIATGQRLYLKRGVDKRQRVRHESFG